MKGQSDQEGHRRQGCRQGQEGDLRAGNYRTGPGFLIVTAVSGRLAAERFLRRRGELSANGGACLQ